MRPLEPFPTSIPPTHLYPAGVRINNHLERSLQTWGDSAASQPAGNQEGRGITESGEDTHNILHGTVRNEEMNWLYTVGIMKWQLQQGNLRKFELRPTEAQATP